MTPTFLAFSTNAHSGAHELHINGFIDMDGDWLYDPAAPQAFRAQLAAVPGELTVFINSPGGNLFAGMEIYTLLREWHGRVHVKVTALAASAGSLIAMAGDSIMMSPGAIMMIHGASGITIGNQYETYNGYQMLQSADEAIALVYAQRTGKPQQQLLEMMRIATWMNAQAAVDHGFADGILFEGEQRTAPPAAMFSMQAFAQSTLSAMLAGMGMPRDDDPKARVPLSGHVNACTRPDPGHASPSKLDAAAQAFGEGIREGMEDANQSVVERATRLEIAARAGILAQLQQ